MNKIFNYILSNKNYSTFTKKAISVFVSLCLLASSMVQAAENGSTSYKNINEMLTIISEYAKSPYTGLIATLNSDEKHLDMSEVELSIIYDGKVIRKVPVDKKGFVDFPLLDKEVGKKASVIINQPKGSISMEMTAGVKPISKLQVPYDELFYVLDDLETVASELVGLPRWMLPDLDYLEFYFDSASTVKLKGADINEFYQSNDENKIKVERNTDLYNKKITLFFSDFPIEVKFINY